ncbi:MAG TPA: FG-GAP-like repeat-containing protein [Candidatus Angelobacter sp.]|jgi:Flp pilus assembly protein TadD|nr:FG-GAP-like repeat-containing protein [Candidatus Angelobacter sp.]
MSYYSLLLSLLFFTNVTLAQTQHPAHPPAKKQIGAVASAEAAHLNNLGAAYMNQQQFARALNLFRRAAALDPKLEIAKVNEGIALANLQKYGAAIKVLTVLANKGHGNASAWYTLGLVYKNQADSRRSLEAFEAAAKLLPSDPDVFYFIGLAQSELDQNDQAVTALQHALELNSFHASAEFGMARAYQRLGEADKARQHLARFQHLVQAKMGVPMSLTYGDQGELSLALTVASAAQPSSTPIPVRFSDISRDAGITASSKESASKTEANPIGSGACFLDFDHDGHPDLFLADGGANGGMALLHNTGRGKFEDVTQKAGLDPKLHAVSCAAGDYDNDGNTDLAVATRDRVLLLHNEGNGTFKDVTEAAGIHFQSAPLAVTFVDYDHDGDLDLFVTSREARQNAVWRNNGNNTFKDVTSDLDLVADVPLFGVTSTDFNNDRAIDLIYAGAKPKVLLNPREGKWSAAQVWDSAKLPPATSAIILDFDKDGWMDVALTHDGSPGITLWRNVNGKSVEQVQLPIKNWRRAWGVTALDYDNDGWIDLAAVGETEDGHGEIRLFRNVGKSGFRDVTTDVGLDAIKLDSPRALLAADVDGDGGTDLLVTQSRGPALLLHNNGGNRNNFLHVSLKGFADNKSAVGTKVEVFAGALWQKWEISGSGYLSQSSTDLVVGLGKERRVDTVRVLWPTGVIQDEAQIAANSSTKILEIDRRGSSCPVLWVWDGTRYRFIADMLGAGVVGHWVGPGERNVPDSTEYIKIDGEHVVRRNGLLSFRFMEPLEEVVYLDQVRLLAIDHPRDLQVYPNEYFASNPPFPEFKVIASRHARPVAGAWDERGNDVLEKLLRRDRRYVTGFELLPYTGFTRTHSLEIELPDAYQRGPLRLLLYGYIEYFTANSMYAAWQGGITPIAPFIEARDSNGKWIRVVDDMGFPAGLPRSTAVDLTGKLPSGTKRLRITTNLQIYWDQILVDTTPEQPEAIKVADVPLSQARLSFRGYPRMREYQSPGEFEFTYNRVSRTGPFTRPIGAYTRLGDVHDLLLKSDDRFVVFGSGDEVQLEFDPAFLPPLPKGWKRDYFFFADGYEKDMDFYAAEGDFVNPLPFHRMSGYPYSTENDLQDSHQIGDLLNYDTRFFSGLASGSYRFRFPERLKRVFKGREK